MTTHTITTPKLQAHELEIAADRAARMIPPAWPLASSVAVNPFLGQTDLSLAETAALLGRVGGLTVTMPRAWYRERIASGRITLEDLGDALEACNLAGRPLDIAELKAELEKEEASPEALPTVADLAFEQSGTDWPGIIDDRIGSWAAGYFDEGQALWAAPRTKRAWEAWRNWATHDLTPEILGLDGFARFVSDAPASPYEAMARAVRALGLSDKAVTTYFHQLALSCGGWGQYARYRLWSAELAGGRDETLVDLLAIRLIWEEALYERFSTGIIEKWETVKLSHEAPVKPGRAQIVDAIAQAAFERASQREIQSALTRQVEQTAEGRPLLQAAFCIDVRSEIYRRSLEAVDPRIRTVGFAGFFGAFTSHTGWASDIEERRLPVLLNPTVQSCSGCAEHEENSSDPSARHAARAVRAWGRFKLAAVSCFAFVEAMGPVYVWRLLRDGFAISGASAADDPAPQFNPPLDLETRIGAGETILRAMSLTSGFGRVVMLAGHGANVKNNPHASALHCGACGGYPGDVNARLVAGLLNDKEVREGLAGRGIEIPSDTLFVAALHDTTTDEITLYDADQPSPEHNEDLAQIRRWLAAAGRVTRGERALRLPRAEGERDIEQRARDWSEVRPEWALAGCRAFIAAPRKRTAGRELHGRAFLHDYDWKQDAERGFPVLELIMTAPVVVASWISLQYYGSVTAPKAFGSGNKLLHNVVGGIGVFEGNGGTMRAGLPWQSVHDGEDLAHEPLRLSVYIEAPVDAMTRILEKHPGVRDLFDNGWLNLFALDDESGVAQRYTGSLAWEQVARQRQHAA